MGVTRDRITRTGRDVIVTGPAANSSVTLSKTFSGFSVSACGKHELPRHRAFGNRRGNARAVLRERIAAARRPTSSGSSTESGAAVHRHVRDLRTRVHRRGEQDDRGGAECRGRVRSARNGETLRTPSPFTCAMRPPGLLPKRKGYAGIDSLPPPKVRNLTGRLK